MKKVKTKKKKKENKRTEKLARNERKIILFPLFFSSFEEEKMSQKKKKIRIEMGVAKTNFFLALFFPKTKRKLYNYFGGVILFI